MYKTSLFILSILCCFSLIGGNINLARTNFSKVKTIGQIDTVLILINNINTPVSNAYKGAYTMMKAKYVSSPFKKYAYFNQGKALIEKAIEQAPNNLEIRYLRAMLQVNLPKFLNYYENLNEDIDFVLKNLMIEQISKELKYKIIINLVAANLISNEQKATFFYLINYERNTSNISR
ncbi:MAG: hypothetical protein CMD31_01520 [Flavobacteriales bacterium]|nr:hypothetical protein [Flavobacteriales bacterium]|tara:strand:+ start:4949 stop:5479 length:531 start_codon:yes stop_codon:yes gene_type:complete